MSKISKGSRVRNRYSDEYKAEAVKLADKVGVREASEQLGIGTAQIYGWRGKAKESASTSDREQVLMQENARLRRELAEQKEEAAILKKATAYFAKQTR